MKPEQNAWIMDRIKRAEVGRLRGSVTFHFNDGKLVSAETRHNEKPLLDENGAST